MMSSSSVGWNLKPGGKLTGAIAPSALPLRIITARSSVLGALQSPGRNAIRSKNCGQPSQPSKPAQLALYEWMISYKSCTQCNCYWSLQQKWLHPWRQKRARSAHQWNLLSRKLARGAGPPPRFPLLPTAHGHASSVNNDGPDKVRLASSIHKGDPDRSHNFTPLLRNAGRRKGEFKPTLSAHVETQQESDGWPLSASGKQSTSTTLRQMMKRYDTGSMALKRNFVCTSPV